jgi:superfamily II DNA or RNA helicase
LIAQKAYELQNKGMTVLITVNQIKHGKTLEQMIKGSKFVHGKTKKDEQHDAMEKLANGKLKIMISTLLGEGWDFQGLNAIILAGGGKSEVALIQKVGRVMRTSKDKKEALIVEIRDNGKWMREHSQLRTMKLVEMYGNN